MSKGLTRRRVAPAGVAQKIMERRRAAGVPVSQRRRGLVTATWVSGYANPAGRRDDAGIATDQED
ncbi:hypothetical protein TSH100_03980 [Azospirillum sp. TSH100]|uniref:hypothetical protein n=1 Tax=Azospirillum sp. TSH100 TaxID=652764 RepID=UPI000D60F95B|nr:hypothetical protein [Azospirillum sp. TSH100]PWC89805.1 hypothetical protein TSH100_03980 [Azospirillum sp. TSH100]QCG92345.1 hypothetical protein E6C72_31565 [Azospirillum sp. TSH100]